MRNRILLLGWILGCLALALTAWAGSAEEGYRPIRTAPGTYRTAALTGGDSVDWTSPLDTAGADASIQPTGGNATLAVSSRFSVSAGTLELRCGLYHRDGASTYTFMGLADTQTVTASADQIDTDGRFMPDRLTYFDLGSATHYELRIPGSVSSGNVNLVPWTFGVLPSGATSQ